MSVADGDSRGGSCPHEDWTPHRRRTAPIVAAADATACRNLRKPRLMAIPREDKTLKTRGAAVRPGSRIRLWTAVMSPEVSKPRANAKVLSLLRLSVLGSQISRENSRN